MYVASFIHSLPLMNSFNKTEAAVFSCRLCFLRAFPFISFVYSVFVMLCVFLYMVPINLTCPHCLQHFFFEHLFHLYYTFYDMCVYTLRMYGQSTRCICLKLWQVSFVFAGPLETWFVYCLSFKKLIRLGTSLMWPFFISNDGRI